MANPYGTYKEQLRDDLQAEINAILDKLPKGTHYTNADQIKDDIVAISTGVQPAGATTSNSPTGTGVASWLFAGGGTYTNYGGLVIPANHIGFITRDGSGNFSYISFELDLSLYAKKSDMAYISNDATYRYGAIDFDNQTRLITLGNGGMLNRNGGITWTSGVSFDYSGINNNDWALFLKGSVLSIESYQTDVSETKKDSYCLARFTLEGGAITAIYWCIADYVLDGVKFKRYYENNTAITANDSALYGTIAITQHNKTIALNAAGVLNRTGVFANIYGKSITYNGLGNNDYGLFCDKENNLSFHGYNENVLETKKNSYCLMRFSLTNGVITNVWYSLGNYSVDGVIYRRYSSTVTKTSSISYCEIGDSISWQFDGKLENFASEGSETGYKQIGGYGQKICKHFGISYVNHHSHGLNGRTFAGYMSEINSPANSDLIWQVPKNADVYTIFLGTNDFGTACPLGIKLDYLNDTLDYNNFGSTMTVYGGIRKMIDYISDTSTTTKDKKIVFITPLGFGAYNGYGGVVSTWEYDSNGEIIEKPNLAGWKMSQLVDAIKWVATQTGSYVIDLYNEQGIFQKNRLNIEGNLDSNGVPLVYQGVLGDNLHPSTNGHASVSKHIISELEKIIVEDNF